MARLETANTIINRAAVEVGLSRVSDPVASTDEHFTQLKELLNAAGQELVEMHPWQILKKTTSFTTVVPGDTGIYDLPSDFAYMVDQTGWDQTNSHMLGGPLTSQDWAYLDGRNLVSSTIYASFRMLENKLHLFPQPPPNGLLIKYEYVNRNWVQEAGGTYRDDINAGSDIVQYEPILIIKLLKAKFLESKGFDTTQAKLDFDTMFASRTGKDTGGKIVSAGGGARKYPYLTPWQNTGDTGYGT